MIYLQNNINWCARDIKFRLHSELILLTLIINNLEMKLRIAHVVKLINFLSFHQWSQVQILDAFRYFEQTFDTDFVFSDVLGVVSSIVAYFQ